MVRPNEIHFNSIINITKPVFNIVDGKLFYKHVRITQKVYFFSLFVLTDVNKAGNMDSIQRKVRLPFYPTWLIFSAGFLRKLNVR